MAACGATGSDALRPDDLGRLLRRSVEVIRENQDAGGAYLASPSLPTYRYSWLRDGAFIADAMSRAGEAESAEAFFRWCADIVIARADRIENLIACHRTGEAIDRDEHLHCRYRPDGSEGGMPWSSFQLDGYGMWIWALGAHASRHARSVEPYAEAIVLSARYIGEFWNEPCFDWWEERFGCHTATLAAVYAGLSTAVELDVRAADAAAKAEQIGAAVRAEGVVDSRLAGELGDPRLDASLISCATPFRLLDPDEPVVEATIRALEAEIAHGGVHRYPGDSYYGGGEWLLLAALLGWHYAEVGRSDEAWAQLAWVAAQAREEGDLPEQVESQLETPSALGDWVRKWGPSASPLLWSHAMFITLALELGVSRE
ncbi:MAG: glycoside hydrolase family 15 protein [Actinomycetota bacterium]|nr:glycoside hydrolase family 15 protein [Actinomycetota bacterium]